MKKFVLAFLLMAVLLVGCSKDPIIGTWEGKSNDGIKTTFTFKSGDKMIFANEYGFEKEGTYKIDGDKINIKHDLWEKTYKFEIKDDKLSLIKIQEYDPEYIDLIKK